MSQNNVYFFYSYRLSPDGGKLTFLRLSAEDSGTYTCLAVSTVGQDTKIYTVYVLGKFKFTICIILFGFSCLLFGALICHSSSIYI